MYSWDADTDAGRELPPPKKKPKPDKKVDDFFPVVSECTSRGIEEEIQAIQDDFVVTRKASKLIILIKKRPGRELSPQQKSFELMDQFLPDGIAIKWEKAGSTSKGNCFVSHFYGFGDFDVFVNMMKESVKFARANPSGVYRGGDKIVGHALRTFYEVIRINRRCKLYFDVEGVSDDKPQQNSGYTLSSGLIDLVKATATELGLDIPVHCLNDVVVLTATRQKKGKWKLSHHVIFHSLFFEDNHCAMKNFTDWMAVMAKKTGTGMLHGKIAWDTAVYTRNRVMRMMCNMKPGDADSELMPMGDGQTIDDFSVNEFRRSLITDTRRGACDLPVYVITNEMVRAPTVSVQPPRSTSSSPQSVVQSATIFKKQEIEEMHDVFVDFHRLRAEKFGFACSDIPPLTEMKFGSDNQANLVFFNIPGDKYCEYKGRVHTTDGGSKTGYYMDVLHQFVCQTCFACMPPGSISTHGLLYNTCVGSYMKPVNRDATTNLTTTLTCGEFDMCRLMSRQAKKIIRSVPAGADCKECYVYDQTRALWSNHMEHFFVFFVPQWVRRHHDMVRAMCAVVPNEALEDSATQALDRWCKKYQDMQGISNMRRMLKSMTTDSRFVATLNQQVDLLPIEGGSVVDVRTGECRPRRAEDLFTIEMNFRLLPPDHPEVLEVVNFMMEFAHDDQDTYDYMHQTIGYSATGRMFDRAFYLWLGNGANGKGTVSQMLQKVLGDFFQTAPSAFLTRKANQKTSAEGASPQFYKMRFARLVMVSELAKNEVLDFPKIKGLCAGDSFSIRALYREPETVEPRFKIIIQSNFCPEIDGSDMATIDRYRLLTWKQRYSNDPQPGELRKDVNRAERFLSLTDAFGTWLVQGATRAYQNGKCTQVVVPLSLKQATNVQLEQMNLIGVYLRAECDVGAGEIEDVVLYEGFMNFAGRRRHNDQYMAFNLFKDKVSDFYNMGFQPNGSKYIGLRIKRVLEPMQPVAQACQDCGTTGAALSNGYCGLCRPNEFQFSFDTP